MDNYFFSPLQAWKSWLTYQLPYAPREFAVFRLHLMHQFFVYYFFIFLAYTFLLAGLPAFYSLYHYPNNLLAQLMVIFNTGIFSVLAVYTACSHWIITKNLNRLSLLCTTCAHFLLVVIMCYYCYVFFNVRSLIEEDTFLIVTYVLWTINAIGISVWYANTWYIIEHDIDQAKEEEEHKEYQACARPWLLAFIKFLTILVLNTTMVYFQNSSDMLETNNVYLPYISLLRSFLVVDWLFLTIPNKPHPPIVFFLNMFCLAIVVVTTTVVSFLMLISFSIFTTPVVVFIFLFYATFVCLLGLHGLCLVHC
jgi:hypothetical protein